jgi:hypothetical protein
VYKQAYEVPLAQMRNDKTGKEERYEEKGKIKLKMRICWNMPTK